MVALGVSRGTPAVVCRVPPPVRVQDIKLMATQFLADIKALSVRSDRK